MKTCQLLCVYNLVALTAVLGALAIVLSAVVLWTLTFTPYGEYKGVT